MATEGVEDGGAGAIYVQLLTARSRRIQWAERFAIGPTTLAACYRELSLKIAASLADAVEQAELARLNSARDPTAYRWFLLGQREYRNFDLPGVRRARRAFKQALQMLLRAMRRRTAGSRGHSSLNGCCWRAAIAGRWVGAFRLPSAQSPLTRRMRAAITQTRHLLALCALVRGSIDCFHKAADKSPQHADLLADFGDALAHSGEPDKGLKKLDEAIVLNPLVPDQYHWYAAGMHYQLGRYKSALTSIARMHDRTIAWRLSAACNRRLGRKREAHIFVRRAMENVPRFQHRSLAGDGSEQT